MQIKPLTRALGAEIIGADVRRAEDIPAIKQAFSDYGVIVIRQQSITPDEHLAFAQQFGEINVNRFFKALDTHPSIATVLKEPEQKYAIGEEWHTDHSYDQIPAMGSILHAIEVPEVGGDTVFSSMAAAYDALSARFKSMLEGLYAVHSSRHAFGYSTQDSEGVQSGRFANMDQATQDARHPVVIRHPLSGRQCIYVNPDFTVSIEGLTKTESDGLLNMLYEHCKQPDFHCRISWRAGDITFWDNRACWHKAINDYDGFRRYMHRVTVEGCALGA